VQTILTQKGFASDASSSAISMLRDRLPRRLPKNDPPVCVVAIEGEAPLDDKLLRRAMGTLRRGVAEVNLRRGVASGVAELLGVVELETEAVRVGRLIRSMLAAAAEVGDDVSSEVEIAEIGRRLGWAREAVAICALRS